MGKTTLFSKLTRCRRGNAAVEFALIAPMFFGLLFAVLETVLVFFAQQYLQSATTNAARLIMTGQAQGMTGAQFQQAVCNDAPALFTCGQIFVNSQKFSKFASVTMLNPLSGGNFNQASLKFSTGAPGDIMLVQVFYQWPVYLAPMGFDLSNMNGNKRLLIGTAVFRNEPF